MSTLPMPAPTGIGGPSPWTTDAQGINKEQGRILIGFTCMFLVLCVACVVGRLLARHKVGVGLEADDHLAIVALVSNIVSRSLRNTFRDC